MNKNRFRLAMARVVAGSFVIVLVATVGAMYYQLYSSVTA